MTKHEEKTPVAEEEAQLTPARKRALIEYLAILFAAAFLLVAVSLFLKMDAMQDDLNVANQGARENIQLMETRLSAAEAENDTLSANLEAARSENDTLSDALETAKTDNEVLTAALETATGEKDALTAELAASERTVEATALLLQSYQSLTVGDSESFESNMAALKACADALPADLQTIYQNLLAALD